MSDGSDIEWCDATWQPVVGCSRISRGCADWLREGRLPPEPTPTPKASP